MLQQSPVDTARSTFRKVLTPGPSSLASPPWSNTCARRDVRGVVETKEEAIRAAIAATGCSPDEAVMVGDRFHDVQGATAVGIPCVGVLFGNTGTREELVSAGATAVVDTTAELEAVLLGR